MFPTELSPSTGASGESSVAVRECTSRTVPEWDTCRTHSSILPICAWVLGHLGCITNLCTNVNQAAKHENVCKSLEITHCTCITWWSEWIPTLMLEWHWWSMSSAIRCSALAESREWSCRQYTETLHTVGLSHTVVNWTPMYLRRNRLWNKWCDCLHKGDIVQQQCSNCNTTKWFGYIN